MSHPTFESIKYWIQYVEIECQLDATEVFYCRSYSLLNMFRASLCPSSGAQEYYTVVAACGISCCGFQVAGPVCRMLQHLVLLRTRNVSGRFVEKTNTHFTFNNFLRISCRLWENVERCCRAWQTTDGNIIRRIRFTCWINKATNTHSEYVILIAFPRCQWLCERTFKHCLYYYNNLVNSGYMKCLS